MYSVYVICVGTHIQVGMHTEICICFHNSNILFMLSCALQYFGFDDTHLHAYVGLYQQCGGSALCETEMICSGYYISKVCNYAGVHLCMSTMHTGNAYCIGVTHVRADTMLKQMCHVNMYIV